MAIKDRKRRRLARLGVIRLGVLVDNATGKGQHPVQTDHFVLVDAPDIQAFYDEKGVEKVRELDVLLPFPDVERNFSAFYQVWAGGVLVCQGDGEFVQYATPLRAEVKQHKKGDQIVETTHVYNASGETLVANGEAQIAFEWNGHAFKPGDTVECPGQSHDFYPHCAACKLSALLKVMMAHEDLFRMGYYQISTGSKRNHDTIMGTLEMFPADHVNSVPFKLRLVEEQVTYTENGQRKKGTKWFLQLEPDPKTTRRLYGRKLQEMLGEVTEPSRPALSAGPDWDEIDPELRPSYVEAGIDAANGYDDAQPLEPDEIIEGSTAPADTTSTNGTRPYAPETIKAKLAPIVAAGSGAPATDKQKSLVAGKLNECFAGDAEADKKRHTVTQYLFGVESLNDADFRQGHVDAVLTWILLNGKTNGTGDYPLHPKAPAEAAGIVRAALEDAGQQVLF